MATRISPAWPRPHRRWRRLVATVALLGALATTATALSACSATDATTQASGEHPVAAAAVDTPPPGVTLTVDVPYLRHATAQQRLDVCAPSGAASVTTPSPASAGTDGQPLRPAVLLVHGGGWMRGDKSDPDYLRMCTWLAREGFVTFSVDYRLAPAVRFPAPLDDVTAALRYVRSAAVARDYRIDPARIGVVGGSAGGNLAALLALRGSRGPLDAGDRVAALVELSGPMDLTAGARVRGQSATLLADELAYLGCRQLSPCATVTAASPALLVDPSDPPVFIGQSAHDFVPPRQGELLRARLRAAGVPVTLKQIPGRAHSIGTLTPTMRADVAAFLHSRLGD